MLAHLLTHPEILKNSLKEIIPPRKYQLVVALSVSFLNS